VTECEAIIIEKSGISISLSRFFTAPELNFSDRKNEETKPLISVSRAYKKQ